MSPFKFFGALLIPLSFIALALVVANRLSQSASRGGHDLIGLAVPALAALVLGIGLMLHQRWAAVLFCAACAVVGLSQVVGSLIRVPMPWLILGVLFGSALLTPCYFTIRCWKMLDKA